MDNVADVRPDGVHFGPAGSKLIATWLLPHIQSAVPYLNLFRAGPVNFTPVVAYGGLNMYEAQRALQRQFETLPFFKLTLRVQPFTALCDILKSLPDDLRQLQPSFIVIADLGASGSACTKDAQGRAMDRFSSQYYAQFRLDVQRLLAVADNVPVIFVEPPALKSDKDRAHVRRLLTIIRDATNTSNQVVISTIAHDAFGGDTWQARLPCLEGEKTLDICIGGTSQVRGPRGNEFCPHGYASVSEIIRGCVQYSSGAVRFSDAIASIIGGATRDLAKSDAIAPSAPPTTADTSQSTRT